MLIVYIYVNSSSSLPGADNTNPLLGFVFSDIAVYVGI